jgi:hypothetical protein
MRRLIEGSLKESIDKSVKFNLIFQRNEIQKVVNRIVFLNVCCVDVHSSCFYFVKIQFKNCC